jgi:hypothetical protein
MILRFSPEPDSPHSQIFRKADQKKAEPNRAVWFSFILTSFSENLAVGRIWLRRESEYHYDYVWRKIKLFIGLRI